MKNDMIFSNSNEAFICLYKFISDNGHDFSGTKCVFNLGFEILNPIDNKINILERKWNENYAIKEWEWYMSGDPSAVEISSIARKWKSCMDSDGNVNSNYGYLWNKGNQIQYVVDELTKNKESRRAVISLYDGKERHNYENDTPCTIAIKFYIHKEKLQMTVMMRSNDLWYGFCNDQYCFSNLQQMIAKLLSIEVGSYYHFANNMHIYNNFLNKIK